MRMLKFSEAKYGYTDKYIAEVNYKSERRLDSLTRSLDILEILNDCLNDKVGSFWTDLVTLLGMYRSGMCIPWKPRIRMSLYLKDSGQGDSTIDYNPESLLPVGYSFTPEGGGTLRDKGHKYHRHLKHWKHIWWEKKIISFFDFIPDPTDEMVSHEYLKKNCIFIKYKNLLVNHSVSPKGIRLHNQSYAEELHKPYVLDREGHLYCVEPTMFSARAPNFCIDIFDRYIFNDYIYHWRVLGPPCKHKYIFPLRNDYIFHGTNNILAPNSPVKILEMQYGADFKTPKRGVRSDRWVDNTDFKTYVSGMKDEQ